MRTREEIEKEIARLRGWSPADATAGCMELSIEVLLDIRELLASQKKVLVGEERSAWLNGLRCVCCGEPKTKDNLSNTCDACWEKQ